MEYSRWKPKGVISPWKMILQIAFSPHQSIKTMHTAIQHLKKSISPVPSEDVKK
jgi:hypothetical protein